MEGKEDRFRVQPMNFEVYDKNGSVLAVRTQLSIVSAYALTVHRSQGFSLQRVAMDFRKVGAWIPTGITYVAFSRCTSMSGLWVRGLEKRHIVVNSHSKTVMQDIMKLKRHFVHRDISNSSIENSD